MAKRNILASENPQLIYSRHQSHSISEIMAAGGATAFANKLGKNPNNIDSKLKELSNDSFLTKEEATQALKALNEIK